MLIWCNLCNLNEHSSLQMSLCQLNGKWFCNKIWGSDKSYNIFWKQACFFYYSLNFDNIYSFKVFKDSNRFYENQLWFEKWIQKSMKIRYLCISYYCNLEEDEKVHGHAKILETCSKLCYVSCFLDLIFSYMTYD